MESDPSTQRARHHKRKRSAARAALLPFEAAHLSKHDYGALKPLFALYLEVQKQMVLEDLSQIEARGRWKSFVGKWCVFYIPRLFYPSKIASTSFQWHKEADANAREESWRTSRRMV